MMCISVHMLVNNTETPGVGANLLKHALESLHLNELLISGVTAVLSIAP